MRRLLVSLMLAGSLLAGGMLTAAPASASASRGDVALNWAEGHATGHPYIYGGSGPYGYDCSGLVMAAYAHAGISLPHSTYAMLSSPRLHRIPLSSARRGDLLFYGSGHVEMATVWYHMSFGAHSSGSRVGWISWWPGSWAPSAAYRVY